MGNTQETGSAVTNPPHYKAGDIECSTVQDALAATLWKGHPKIARLMNALKYLWRACSKGNFDQDVRKAAFEMLSCIGEGWRMRAIQVVTQVTAVTSKDRVWWADVDGDRVDMWCRHGNNCITINGAATAYIETAEQRDNLVRVLQQATFEK